MKNLIKIISIFCLSILLFSCDNDDDVTMDCACFEIFQPVCGDDGIEYTNSCYAECAGMNFTEGACEVTTNAVVRDLGDPALDGCGWVIEFEVEGELENHRPDTLAEEHQLANLQIELTYKPTLQNSQCGLIETIPVIEVIEVLE